MKQDINKIKTTIRNLLNVASNDASADGEITNALTFAKSLMLRYHLEEADIPDQDSNVHIKAAIKEIKDTFVPVTGKSICTWELHLAYFCKDFLGSVGFYMNKMKTEQKTEHGTIKFDKNGKPKVGEHIVFYGAYDEVDLARHLFEEISLVITVMARMKYGSLLRGKGRSYADGFVVGLKEKLKTATLKIENDPNSKTLIVQSKELIAQKLKRGIAFLKAKGIRLTKGSGPSGGHNSNAFNSGKTDGKNYTPSKGTTTKKLN